MALRHEVDQRAKLENNYCEQLFSQLKPLPVRFKHLVVFIYIL